MATWLLLLALNPLFDIPARDWNAYAGQQTAKGTMRLELFPGARPIANKAGDYVLGYGGQPHDDLSLPNPAFFQFLDRALKVSSSKKVVVELIALPATQSSEWDGMLQRAGEEGCLDFGRYLARRYQRQATLIFARPTLDTLPDQARTCWSAFLRGIGSEGR
jgi:hypothetical protein